MPKTVETFWLLSLNIICAFLCTTKFTKDAKKKVKCQELLVLIFTILQLASVLFATFVVQPGFSPKPRERDNQTRCGQIEIKNIHDNLTADFDN